MPSKMAFWRTDRRALTCCGTCSDPKFLWRRAIPCPKGQGNSKTCPSQSTIASSSYVRLTASTKCSGKIIVSSQYNALDRVFHPIQGNPSLETIQTTLMENVETCSEKEHVGDFEAATKIGNFPQKLQPTVGQKRYKTRT